MSNSLSDSLVPNDIELLNKNNADGQHSDGALGSIIAGLNNRNNHDVKEQDIRPSSKKQGHERHGGRRALGVVPSQQEGCCAANARSEECEIHVQCEQQPAKLDQAICTAGRLQDPESRISEAHYYATGTSFQCVEDLHLKNAIYALHPDKSLLPSHKQLGSTLLDKCHAELLSKVNLRLNGATVRLTTDA
ncbi:unnamed protein product [Sphagnum balticum]